MLTVGVGNDNCNRKPLAHEAMRCRSHRECGGVLSRRGRRADDGGKRAGGVRTPSATPGRRPRTRSAGGRSRPSLSRTKATARRDDERSRSSRKKKRYSCSSSGQVSQDHERTACDVQQWRPRRARIVRSQGLPLNAAVKTRVCDFVRKDSVRVENRSEERYAVSLSGNSAARAMQRSGASPKEAIFTIDKRRVRGLSSEKIFVAVCERSLTHATEARTASHTAPLWARERFRFVARSSTELHCSGSQLTAKSDGHHAVDSGARLALVKALASLDPLVRALALTNRSIERADCFYVMADDHSVQQQRCDAEENNFARRSAHGPPDSSGLSWLQLLDVARSRAQRTHPRSPYSEPSRARRPRDAPNSDRLTRPGPPYRTLEGGGQLRSESHMRTIRNHGRRKHEWA